MTQLESVRKLLDDISQTFADQRVHYCQVEAASLAEDTCRLAGTVLDRATLETIANALGRHFPTLKFQTEAVAILRREAAVWSTVQTNLTGLFAKATFYSEQAAQLMAGQQLETLRQEKSWTFVRQQDGYLGWTYTPYLTQETLPPATHLVYQPLALVRHAPQDALPPSGRLFAGTAVAVLDENNGFCQVALPGGTAGWLDGGTLRRMTDLVSEPAAQRREMITWGQKLMGVPYWWGGSSMLGIDCSGFVQLLHRLVGVTLPRDADMQMAAGRPQEPPFQAGDLLFFGGKGGHRAITHVGMSLGGWEIIHSSRPNNGVYIDDVQKTDWLKNKYAGAVTFID